MTREEALAQFQQAYGGRFDSDAAGDFDNLWRQSTDAKEGQAEGFGLQNSSPFASLFAAYAPRIEERFMPTSGRVVDSQSQVAANLYGDNPFNRATSGENPGIYAPASSVPKGFAPFAINASPALKSLYSNQPRPGMTQGGAYGGGVQAPDYSMSGRYSGVRTSNMGQRNSIAIGDQNQGGYGQPMMQQQLRRQSPYRIAANPNQTVRQRMGSSTGLGLT